MAHSALTRFLFHPAHAGGAFLLPCILTRCRAFFLPGYNTDPYKRLQRVLCSQCNYTTHAAKQRTRLYSGFSCDYTHSTAHDTRPTQAAIIPPSGRWRVYTRPDALNQYRIPLPRLDAVQHSTASYYNKVYKGVQGRALLWINARRCSISQTMPARRLAVWHQVSGQTGRSGTLHPAEHSSSKGVAGGAKPLTATAVSLFRAFAR